MPTATTPRPASTSAAAVDRHGSRGFWQAAETTLQALHIYGAAGITAFGWAMAQLLGRSAAPWLPLWFCSALLLYNVDRLRRDPADRLNTPIRESGSRRLRPWSWLLTWVSACVLIFLPIIRHDWLTLVLTIGGALFCLNYSLPVKGFRLKDVPLLKTFFAPTLVIAAVFGLIVLHDLSGIRLPAFLVAGWAWSILFCNMLLCDLRDVAGDRRCGVESVPLRLGPKHTHFLLWALTTAIGGTGFLIAIQDGNEARLWRSLALANSCYLAGLLLAVRRWNSERFYEWWVEGVLFVPAIVILATNGRY